MKTPLATAICSTLLLLWGTVAGADEWAKRFPIEKDIPGTYSYDEISRKDYKGVVLNIISHEPPNLGEAVAIHASQFEELTGAKINVRFVAYRNLFSEIMWGLAEREYDVVFRGGEWIADVAPYLEPLPKKMLDSMQYKNIVEPFRQMGTWEGVPVETRIDGDKHYLQYRKDLFQVRALRKLFREEYGRELDPPKTWKEYAEIARFFNGKIVDGKIIYGATEITKKTDLVYSQFLKRAAPYAKHPDVKGGLYFDLETMKPLINTPGFVEALKDFVEIQQYLPPGGSNYSLVDALLSFGRGDAVLSDMWDDAFIKAMEPGSSMRGRVAASLSPGARKVWNRKTGMWDKFPDVNYVPYVPESWAAGVSKHSKAKDAAFDFLGFFANPANHKADMLVGRRGINSFRVSCGEKSFWLDSAGWDEETTASYLRMWESYRKEPNHAYPLRIIESRRYLVALSEGIHKALAGSLSPQRALDAVARKWTELNERVGINRQRSAYAQTVALEDGESAR